MAWHLLSATPQRNFGCTGTLDARMQSQNAQGSVTATCRPFDEASSTALVTQTRTMKSPGIKRASTACRNCKMIKRRVGVPFTLLSSILCHKPLRPTLNHCGGHFKLKFLLRRVLTFGAQCNQREICSNCRKTGIECIYDEAQDGRRRAARRNRVEEHEWKSDALDAILGALRQAGEADSQILLSLIKSNAPLDEIVQYALHHCGDSSNARLTTSNVIVDTDSSRRSALSIPALCDTRIIHVRAAPQISVMDDDQLALRLV